MLANSPKDNPISSADACALYYFPEIPCRDQKHDVPASGPATFVGGAVETLANNEPSTSNPEDSEQVRALIDDAFAKGMVQGRAETEAAQQEHLQTAVGALQTAIESVEQLRIKDVQRMETETVRLALAIAKKIVGTVAGQEQTIAHVVKAAMLKVADHRQLLIRLNPATRWFTCLTQSPARTVSGMGAPG